MRNKCLLSVQIGLSFFVLCLHAVLFYIHVMYRKVSNVATPGFYFRSVAVFFSFTVSSDFVLAVYL